MMRAILAGLGLLAAIGVSAVRDAPTGFAYRVITASTKQTAQTLGLLPGDK